MTPPIFEGPWLVSTIQLSMESFLKLEGSFVKLEELSMMFEELDPMSEELESTLEELEYVT